MSGRAQMLASGDFGEAGAFDVAQAAGAGADLGVGHAGCEDGAVGAKVTAASASLETTDLLEDARAIRNQLCLSH